MTVATFRFYEELNDFLAPERRKREFRCACARAATTKHMIEALGVPHTEVELILVNGESVGFDRLLREIFERLDLARSARPPTLCLHCNAPLRDIDKAQVLEQLPPSVRNRHGRFTTCDVCRRVFWEGSHGRHMRALLDELMPDG
ncbi:MAG: Mut7-C RNAse domain-containing protein [Pseudomonadota bacterium]|jgi:hypothetical protein